VTAVIYSAFLLVTWFADALPWWLLLLIGATLVAWQGSLQHEVAHGHPTPWPLVNRLIVLPSLWLWLPFERYRTSHLTHHQDDHLTEPELDPESYYLSPARWETLSTPAKWLLTAHNTLLGRLLIGPPLALWRYLRREIGEIAGGAPWVAVWLTHLVAVALVLGWAIGVCGLAFWEYLLYFAYPGLALTLLRSFLEHRAHPEVAARTAIVEADPFFALLFLNNNLHVVHHDHPGLPWYSLPAVYREKRVDILAKNRKYFYKGYGEVFRYYLFSPKERPVHPGLTG
jgi:fatty acid desaturase